MSDFFSSVCSCKQIRETATYIIIYCDKFTKFKANLTDSDIRQINIKELINDSENAI